MKGTSFVPSPLLGGFAVVGSGIARCSKCFGTASSQRRWRPSTIAMTSSSGVPSGDNSLLSALAKRIAICVVSTALVCQMGTSSMPVVGAAEQESFLNTTVTASKENVETKTESELREQSRRNTRITGAGARLFARARRTAGSGDIDTAVGMYEELIKMAPQFAPGYSNLGNLLVAKGRFSQALPYYNLALELAPLDGDSWVVYVNRGCTRLALGEDAQAVLSDMNRALELKGENGVVLSNRAVVYEALGKYDNAIHDYQQALSSNDVQPFWIRYALALFQKGKSYEALSILKRAVARFNVSDVHAALAVIYFDRGEVAQAETEWSAVDRPKLFQSRAFLEQERKWPPKAVDAMDRFKGVKE